MFRHRTRTSVTDGIYCPFCESERVIKRGFDDTEPSKQRYECKDCGNRFDDLTETIFAGHHQPLEVWILCLYFMGLNLSNEQIAKELDLDQSDVQEMTSLCLSSGVVRVSTSESMELIRPILVVFPVETTWPCPWP